MKYIKSYKLFESMDMYENTLITVKEFNDLVKERSILMTDEEVLEITNHINKKYSSKYNIEISHIEHWVLIYLIYFMSGKSKITLEHTISIYKLTDEWFAISYDISSRISTTYYKCDEMQGLFNQIDELFDLYV
jgi:hypothetical protein